MHPGGSQQGALDLREAVHRGHRRDHRAHQPPPVGRVQASPRLGQLVPAQGDLDAEHDRVDDQHRPPQPPVLAARSRCALAGQLAGRGLMDTGFRVTVLVAPQSMHVTAVSGSLWGRDRIVAGCAGPSGRMAGHARPAPGYACPMSASLDDASVEPIVRKPRLGVAVPGHPGRGGCPAMGGRQARDHRRAGFAGPDDQRVAAAGGGLAGPARIAARRRRHPGVAEQVAVLGGILTFVVSQFVVGLPDLVEQVTHSIDSTRKWLIEGPAHLSRGRSTTRATPRFRRCATTRPS